MLSRSSNITCDTSTHNPYCTFRHDPQEPWRLSGVKLCLTVSTRCSTSTSTCALEGEHRQHRGVSPEKFTMFQEICYLVIIGCSFKIGHRDFEFLDLKKIFLVTNITIYWSYIYIYIPISVLNCDIYGFMYDMMVYGLHPQFRSMFMDHGISW